MCSKKGVLKSIAKFIREFLCQRLKLTKKEIKMNNLTQALITTEN